MSTSPWSGGEGPPTFLQRVDALCDGFEAAWKAGRRPRIEDFLHQAPQPDRATVAAELIAVECGYRRRAGESPPLDEYRRRFPDMPPERLARAVAGPEPAAPSAETAAPPASGPLRPAALAAADTWSELTLRGTPLGVRYELLEEVGRGGMGVVYRARHKALDKEVAIKIVLPDAPTERFLREARLLARIRSPFVVLVHDFDILDDRRPILVMEWVEGEDLHKVLRRQGGPLPEDRCLAWMRDVAEGMLAAAEQGIIHRDLKPSNILIDRQGRARVADFGLARDQISLEELSQPGCLMGTPFYMAPEQAEDPRGVDARADVYSFGATFYHALTGVPPFQGATAFAVLFKHKTEPLTAPGARNAALSPRTCELLERCLAKSPGDRFASFTDVLEQLRPRPGTPSAWDAGDDAGLAPYLERYAARRDSYLTSFCNGVREVDTYEFPHGRRLRVLGGNLVEQDVDVIVSSNTSSLTMDYGVSQAIREAAGPGFVAEVRRYARVLPGRVAVTSGGRLRARYIFHAATIGYDAQRRVVYPSRDLISEILTCCFYHADSLCVRTIAFPLLATGGAGFPKAVCLDTMFRFLARTLLRGLTSVREASVVIYE